MRTRLALSLVALGALLVGATVAQDAAPTVPRPADPLVQALGGDTSSAPAPNPPVAVAASRQESALQDPVVADARAAGLAQDGGGFSDPEPTTAPEPAADAPVSDGFTDGPPEATAPDPLASFVITSEGPVTFFGGEGTDDWAYLTAQDGTTIQWAQPSARGTNLYTYQSSGQSQLRVSVDDSGRVSVQHNGAAVPAEQLKKAGRSIEIHDAQGRRVATVEITPDGRVTIPRGWTFQGPAAWTTEAQSRKVIGIRTGAVEAPLAQHLGLGEGEGVLVTAAVDGHPAARAGLRAHDVIIAIDGKRPATLDRLKSILQEKPENGSVVLTVVRGGHTHEIRCGVTTVSAPVGMRTALPSGRYAFDLGGGGGGGDFTFEEGSTAPAPTLLWRRGASGGSSSDGGGRIEWDTTTGAWARSDTPSNQQTRDYTRGGDVVGGAAGGRRTATGARGGLIGRLVDPETGGAATDGWIRGLSPLGADVTDDPDPGGSADRWKRIEDRLERLENLLERILESKSDQSSAVPTNPPRYPSAKKIDGVVLSRADDVVILSVGSDDRVEVGDTFTVYEGDHFIGKVEVLAVHPDHAATRVKFTDKDRSIEEGQKATTRLENIFRPSTGTNPRRGTGLR